MGVHNIAVLSDETILDLAIDASRNSIREAEIRPEQIDLILDFSVTGTCENGVALGFGVQADLPISNARVLKVGSAACASFHGAMLVARSMLESEPAIEHILLVAGESPPEEARVMFPLALLGDGAAAMVMGRNHESSKRLVSVEITSTGTLRKTIGVPKCHDRVEIDLELLQRRLFVSHLKGVRDTCLKALDSAGISLDDVDLLIPPNMSKADQDAYRKILGFPVEDAYRFALPDTGHVFGCDCIINWCRAEENHVIPGRGIVLLASSGAGFGWGAAVIEIR